MNLLLLAGLIFGLLAAATPPANADVSLQGRSNEGDCRAFTLDSYGPAAIKIKAGVCWKRNCYSHGGCVIRVCMSNLTSSWHPRVMRLELDHVGRDPHYQTKFYIPPRTKGQRLCQSSYQGVKRITMDGCRTIFGTKIATRCGSDSWWAPTG